MNSMIEIGGVAIHADKQGRYSLNDLHRAAGGEDRHRPSRFAENQQTRELAEEIGKAGIPALVSVKGGNARGTYASKELVYAYAMWISPAFHVRVIRAYDALATGAIDQALSIARGEMERQRERQMARLEAPALSEAVRHMRKVQGKEVEHYHFVNEFDLINRIALGMSAKQFRAAHGIGQNEGIRDHLSPLEIKCILHLQRHNAVMIDLNMSFDQRKAELHKLYCLRYAGPLACEVQRLEA